MIMIVVSKRIMINIIAIIIRVIIIIMMITTLIITIIAIALALRECRRLSLSLSRGLDVADYDSARRFIGGHQGLGPVIAS